VAARGDGRAACSLRVQPIAWELREQKGWQRPCNETPPSPHCTWGVRRRGGRASEENRVKSRWGARGREREVD